MGSALHPTPVNTIPAMVVEGPRLNGDYWQSGLCSDYCGGDGGTCLAAWFCTCFLYGRVSDRLNEYPEPIDKKFWTLFNADCCMIFGAAYFIPCCVPFIFCMQRNEVREHFSIRGNWLRDLVTSCLCGVCALAQMNMEMKARAERARNVLVTAGYTPPQQPQMVYSPVATSQPSETGPRLVATTAPLSLEVAHVDSRETH